MNDRKENSVKVSILVPVYNVEKYLPKFLDSLVHQTLTEIEIIIVNDASPDQCHSLINEYLTDHRIKYINKKVNQGLWRARQSAYEIATGEYIINLDPDDYIDKNYLKELFSYAQQHDLDVVQSNVTTIDGEGKQLDKGLYKQLERIVLNEDTAYKTLLKTPYASWFRLVKKELLERYKYNYIEHRELMHYALQFCDDVKVGVNPLVSYYYRKHGTSLSNYNKSSKRLSETKEYSWDNIQSKTLKINDLPISSSIKRKMLNMYVFRVIYTLTMISWLVDYPVMEYRIKVRNYLHKQYAFGLANYLSHVLWFKRSDKIFLTLCLFRMEFLIRKILTNRVNS